MIKKLIRELAVVFLLMILFVIPARAAEDTITLEANGNQVTVTLTPAAGSEEEIRSLQVSFEISSKEGKPPKEDEVSFDFNGSIKSDVKEFRYQESTGILTIYLSGGQDILSGSGNDRKASLGEIVLPASSEYTVRMKEGSLTTVNGAFDMEENKGASSTVTVGSGNSGATNPSGGGSGSGSSGSSGGWSSNESDGRRPSGGTTSNRFPSFVTSTNTAPNPSVVIKPAVTPSSSETTASNEQDTGNAPSTQQSSPAENGSTASPDNNKNKNSQSPSVAQNTHSGTGNNGNNGKNGTGSAGDGKEKEKEGETMNKEEASGSQSTVSEETQSPDETVTEAPEETQKETEASVQTGKKAEDEKKGLNVTWLIIIFAVIAVACAAAVLVMQASDNPKGKKRFKK